MRHHKPLGAMLHSLKGFVLDKNSYITILGMISLEALKQSLAVMKNIREDMDINVRLSHKYALIPSAFLPHVPDMAICLDVIKTKLCPR
jgi:hypothetical protein